MVANKYLLIKTNQMSAAQSKNLLIKEMLSSCMTQIWVTRDHDFFQKITALAESIKSYHCIFFFLILPDKELMMISSVISCLIGM